MAIIDKSVQRKKLNMKIKEFLKHFFDNTGKESVGDSDFLAENGMTGLAHLRWNDLNLPDNQSCLEFAKVLASPLRKKIRIPLVIPERVCYYSDIISKRLSLYPKERTELQIASYLHDIGKVGISDRFINKKGTLTSTDWAIIKQHTKKSIDLLAPSNFHPIFFTASNTITNILTEQGIRTDWRERRSPSEQGSSPSPIPMTA